MNSVVPLLARVTASAAVRSRHVSAPAATPAAVLVVSANTQAALAIAAFGPTAVAALPADIAHAEHLAEGWGARTLRLEANCGVAAATFADCAARPLAGLCGTSADRLMHGPGRRARDEAFYRTMVSGDPGAPCLDALSAGYRRNFAICASLVRQVRSGERVVLLAAPRDLPLLRQCVAETPGLKPASEDYPRP
ncbi:MAG: hypothetical protein DI570_14135 [Phenylobacterium zucineum]|nr:MAG: hypothetical protein DI570_14135 [Phenylobacterium zucineum]